jgi:hypothetical protein
MYRTALQVPRPTRLRGNKYRYSVLRQRTLDLRLVRAYPGRAFPSTLSSLWGDADADEDVDQDDHTHFDRLVREDARPLPALVRVLPTHA